jgi:hypothetical protein
MVAAMSQRSPINVVLLAAATLALDAVAITWLARAGGMSAAAYLYDALVSAQLAVVTLWAIFGAKHSLNCWVATIAATLAFAKVSAPLTDLAFIEQCGIYGAFVATLAVALWVLRRTSAWQKLTASSPKPWQYSLGNMLALMTLLAILTVAMRRSEVLPDLWKLFTILTVGDLMIALATTILWATAWTHVLRLSTICLVAVVVGLGDAWAQPVTTAPGLTSYPWVESAGYAIIMSFVIFIWLELAPIVPGAHRAKAAPSEAQS